MLYIMYMYITTKLYYHLPCCSFEGAPAMMIELQAAVRIGILGHVDVVVSEGKGDIEIDKAPTFKLVSSGYLLTPELLITGLLITGLLITGLLNSGLLNSGLLNSGLLITGLLIPGLLITGLLISGLLITRLLTPWLLIQKSLS